MHLSSYIAFLIILVKKVLFGIDYNGIDTQLGGFGVSYQKCSCCFGEKTCLFESYVR